MNLVRLKVLGQILNNRIRFSARRYTVVTDQREGNNKHLALIRRISNRLRVANHTGLEDKLTSGGNVSTKGVTLDSSTVLKLQSGKLIGRVDRRENRKR